MTENKYFINDNVEVPEEIKNMTSEELNEEIKKMEKQLQERKK